MTWKICREEVGDRDGEGGGGEESGSKAAIFGFCQKWQNLLPQYRPLILWV